MPFDTNAKSEKTKTNSIGIQIRVIYPECDWSTSSLRTWLNNDFLASFEPDEANRIRKTKLDNSYSTEYDYNVTASCELGSSDDTEDSVFILSKQEFFRYFDGKPYGINVCALRPVDTWCRSPNVIQTYISDGKKILRIRFAIFPKQMDMILRQEYIQNIITLIMTVLVILIQSKNAGADLRCG